MKYEPLSAKQLQELEQDFIQFLAANSVTAPDWEKLKTEKPQNATELVNMFSDIVWDKALTNIKYIKHVTNTDVRVFFYGEKKAGLRGITISGTQVPLLELDLGAIKTLPTKANVKVAYYQHQKNYIKPRNEELFSLIKAGAQPCTQQWWDALNKPQ